MTQRWPQWRGSRTVWPVLVVLFLGCAQALASDLSEPFDQALVALETNDCPAALSALQGIPQPPPEPIRKRTIFLTGYCLFKTDRPADALPFLEQAATEYELLGDYAMAYAAQAALALEDQRKATELLSRLLARYPNTPLAEEAHFRLATTYLEMEQRENAEKALRDFLRRYPASDLAPEASLILAKSLLAVGRDQEAAPTLKRLYIRFPTDPSAAEAERLLRETKLLTTLTPHEHFVRAKALYDKGKYREAATALTPVLHTDPDKEEVRLLLGRSLFAMKKYSKAIATLRPLTDRTVPASFRMKALYLLGRASHRSGRYSQGITYLKRIPALFPRSRLADDAFYIMGLSQEDRGNVAAALEVYTRLLQAYPRGGLGDSARWRRAWLLYRQKKLQPANHELEHLLEDYPHSSHRGQALYWRGRLWEELGKEDLAIRTYQRLLKEEAYNPYYFQAARQRLGLKPSRLSPGPLPSQHSPNPPGMARARELFFLRLWEEAAAEYWEIAAAHPRRVPLQWEACEALTRADQFDRVYTLAQRTKFTLFRTGKHEELLPSFWTFLYPRAFWSSVDHYARETHLDPYLVAALIREESAFSPTAVSRAGARGLMQLMPATAARVATRAGVPNPPDLDTPGVNIALGTWYLARLYEQFDGNVVLTLAAYNAGPHAVRRWLKDQHPLRDPETFIEEIPYPETQRYVKRVLGSYDRYRTLYARPG